MPYFAAPSPPLPRPSSSTSKVPLPNQKSTPNHIPHADMPTQSTIPTATIDADRISDAMAARLSVSLLGHVLYLKGQVPFPVAQLNKMARSNSDSRSSRKLDNLLSSFDLLSSHLNSTFTSLSTALSQNASRYPVINDDVSSSSWRPQRRRRPAKVHIVFVLGSTIATATAMKARVVLEIDGLEVKRLGERDDLPVTDVIEDKGECAASQSLSGSENAHSRSSSLSSTRSNTTDSSGRTPLSEKSITCSDKEPLEDDDDAHERGSASGETVPDSDSEESGVGEDEEDESEEYDEEWESENDDHEPPAPDPRYDESTLLAAERLLSRTLAVANADPDMGMAAEIPPTHIHVLIRAPRRFSHPTWVPKQNLSRVIDDILTNFEQDSSPKNEKIGTQKRFLKAAVKTDGVRVCCRGAQEDKPAEDLVEEQRVDEQDELIWWSWDGKLEGLAEL